MRVMDTNGTFMHESDCWSGVCLARIVVYQIARHGGILGLSCIIPLGIFGIFPNMKAPNYGINFFDELFSVLAWGSLICLHVSLGERP